MKSTSSPQDRVFIISSIPDRQEWVMLHPGGSEHRFPDRGNGKIPGLVDAIRHCFWDSEGQPSLLLIQHGGQQFRLRFHGELSLNLAQDTSLHRRDADSDPLPALAQMCALG